MTTFYFYRLLLTVVLTNGYVIESPHITNWGSWGTMERCPPGKFAQGFQLKTEASRGRRDDSALNAIRLFCGDPDHEDTKVITSKKGKWGRWGELFYCHPGVLTGFQLRVEPDQLKGDDSATNNINFWCTDGDFPYIIEGDGQRWGRWGDHVSCDRSDDDAICGIRTQVERNQGSGDDSALNNVAFECCSE